MTGKQVHNPNIGKAAELIAQRTGLDARAAKAENPLQYRRTAIQEIRAQLTHMLATLPDTQIVDLKEILIDGNRIQPAHTPTRNETPQAPPITNRTNPNCPTCQDHPAGIATTDNHGTTMQPCPDCPTPKDNR